MYARARSTCANVRMRDVHTDINKALHISGTRSLCPKPYFGSGPGLPRSSPSDPAQTRSRPKPARIRTRVGSSPSPPQTLLWTRFRTRFRTRISCHAQEGAIMNNARATHNISISRDSIIQNISIIGRAADPRRLRLLEALLIAERKPTMSTTQEALLLPTNSRRVMPNTHQIQRIPENDNPENGDAPDERGALRDNPPTTTERVNNDIIHPPPNSSHTTDDVSRHDITQRQANGNAGMSDIPRLRRSVRIEPRRRNLA
ncbi:uncharacterized protein [Macrobrachium rosenbergii]|uniref:uncharacterized protein n=1 Tax=Macrobrachium rosenbergii TaxID=79674 RepID=UPI0034D42AEC